ncbi:MAG: GNAT family N-acetyltransferase [Saprospiraceae bacterium]|nr:GNAT family N-acetyltransferase [Saprospiraceae bacterium]
MKYTIQKPEKNRMEDVVELCSAHASFERSEYNSEGKAKLLRESLSSNHPKLYCLVAIVKDEYIGYITWMKQFSTWDAKEYLYMDCLYLDVEFRGFGIGEALVDHMKDFGKKENIDLVQWQTPDFNKRAIKFYERIGAYGKSKERFFLHIK